MMVLQEKSILRSGAALCTSDLRQGMRNIRLLLGLYLLLLSSIACAAQAENEKPVVYFDRRETVEAFGLVERGHAAAIYIAPANPKTVRVAAEAFASDIERVTGTRPQ